MINNVTLVGRLTKDPDLRYTSNGVAVANFTIAVNRPFKKENEQKSEADFINCVIWRRPAENLANFMKKGSLLGLVGRIQTRSYEGQDGKMVYLTEVVAEQVQFLDSKGSNNNGGQNNPNQNQNANNDNPFEGNGEPIDISDDDLPF